MEIYGHKLPDKLYELIKDKDRDDLPFVSATTLRKLLPQDIKIGGGFFGGIRFDDIAGIKRESQPGHLLDLGEIYFLASSKQQKKAITELHMLDIDNALLIAGNHDEEAIALDYRNSSVEPRVLGSFHPKEWVLLANSFEEFAEKVGL